MPGYSLYGASVPYGDSFAIVGGSGNSKWDYPVMIYNPESDSWSRGPRQRMGFRPSINPIALSVSPDMFPKCG